jgi:hypothetical protein
METTAGPISNGAATPHIHQALAGQGLLPTTHIVDTGDLDAELLVTKSIHMTLVHIGCREPKLGRYSGEPHCANLVWTDLGLA